MTGAAERYRAYLESLSPADLMHLEKYVSKDVHFQDPLNDVNGVEAMRKVFLHMYDTVGPVTFTVLHAASDADTCLMSWRFSANLRGSPWNFEGTSVVQFNPEGQVLAHTDYWDAAGSLYEKFPIIGGLLRRLRRMSAAR